MTKLEQKDSNLRITDYKPVALPLSYVPIPAAVSDHRLQLKEGIMTK